MKICLGNCIPLDMDMQAFQLAVEQEAQGLEVFLEHLVRSPPSALPQLVEQKNKEVWAEVSCLECANCCKTMTPHYTDEDVHRIASHFNISEDQFRRRYLIQYSNGDWVNLSYPCSFLGADNKCSIYEIRPQDCAGFPHHHVQPFTSRRESYAKNMHNCPATFKLITKLKESLDEHQKR